MKSFAALRALGWAIIAVQLLPGPGLAAEAPYPVKPIRLVVPFPPGGPVELLGRAFTQRLAEALGQPFVFDNSPGASGTIGTELVARALRDGYTLQITNCSHSSNVAYYRKLPYGHREADRHPAAVRYHRQREEHPHGRRS